MKNLTEKQKYELCEKSVKKDWYVQGFNGFPLFLGPSAYSGMVMKNKLGFCYTSFSFFYYKNGYGEMNYLNSDLKIIWESIKENLRKD